MTGLLWRIREREYSHALSDSIIHLVHIQIFDIWGEDPVKELESGQD